LAWTAGVLTGLLVCCVGSVGAMVGLADVSGALDTQASWRPGASATQTPPSANAAPSVWIDWARRTVEDKVTSQAAALLAGDEGGFLAPVDPANSKLVAEHKRRFTALRAMGLGAWTESVSGALTSTGARSWTTEVKITYCFGDPTCRTVPLPVGTSWSFKNDQLVMVALKVSDADWNGPRPWETDELSVLRGDRVVLATTKANAWRLPDAVKAADRAARVADTFAKWEEAPSRYVIFLAGPSDWTTWYGHDQPEWAAAWAVPVSNTVTEVVIRTQVVRQSGLESLLRHELTHVTTLAGKRDGAGESAWWLIEGIAEYAMMQGRAVHDYDALAPTRSFVRGRWNGDPAVAAPSASASLNEASGRYGVAFLTIRRISDKYTQAKLLDFWGSIVHDAVPLDEASRTNLGVAWSTVKADCVKFIRASVA
jgi:hypothetical protein